MAMEMDKFAAARESVLGQARTRQGIGEQREKTLHAVLKHYYAPCASMHEQKFCGYIADIHTGREIIEIQTRQLYRMRAKLSCFLEQCPVTIVHPIPHNKWLSWIDVGTGECGKLRKSPKTGNVYQAFYELCRIKPFLGHENIRFIFPLVDMEEYRLLDGWSRDKKRGSNRYDRIPLAISDEVRIDYREDYLQFIPYGLAEPFGSKDLAKLVKISQRDATCALYVLHHLEIVKRVERKRDGYRYVVNT